MRCGFECGGTSSVVTKVNLSLFVNNLDLLVGVFSLIPSKDHYFDSQILHTASVRTYAVAGGDISQVLQP